MTEPRTVIIERPTLAEAKAEALDWIEQNAADLWNHIKIENLPDGARITIEVGP